MNWNSATKRLNRILDGYTGDMLDRKISDIKYYIEHGALLNSRNLEQIRSGRLDLRLSSIITTEIIRNSEKKIDLIRQLLSNGKFNFDNIGVTRSMPKLDIVINWLLDSIEPGQLYTLTQIFLNHSDEDITGDATRLFELLELDPRQIPELKESIYNFKHRLDMKNDDESTLGLNIQRLKELITKGKPPTYGQLLYPIPRTYTRIPSSHLLNRILYNLANNADNMDMNITEGLTYLIQNGALLNEYVIYNVLDKLDSTEHGREALSIIYSSDLVGRSITKLNMLRDLLPNMNTNNVEEFIYKITTEIPINMIMLIRMYGLFDKIPDLIEILELNPTQLLEDTNQSIRETIEYEIFNKNKYLSSGDRAIMVNDIIGKLNGILTYEEVKEITKLDPGYVNSIFDAIRIREVVINYINQKEERQKQRQTKERQRIQAKERQLKERQQIQIQERQLKERQRIQAQERTKRQRQSQERQRNQAQERTERQRIKAQEKTKRQRQSQERQKVKRQSHKRQRQSQTKRQSQERQLRERSKARQLQEMNARFRTYLSVSQPRVEQVRADVSKLKPEVVKTVDKRSLKEWTNLNNAWKSVTGNPEAVFNDQEIKKEIMLIEKQPDVSLKEGFYELLDILMKEFNSRMISSVLFEANNYRNQGSVTINMETARQPTATASASASASARTARTARTATREVEDVEYEPRYRGMEIAGIRHRSRL